MKTYFFQPNTLVKVKGSDTIMRVLEAEDQIKMKDGSWMIPLAEVSPSIVNSNGFYNSKNIEIVSDQITKS